MASHSSAGKTNELQRNSGGRAIQVAQLPALLSSDLSLTAHPSGTRTRTNQPRIALQSGASAGFLWKLPRVSFGDNPTLHRTCLQEEGEDA